MKNKPFTIEHLVYAFAFLLALVLRLFHLGAAPLGDFEAGWALQALDLARGQPFNFGPQPLYVLFTSLAFALLSGSNGLARLLPALAGSSLVLLPLFLRRWTNGATGLRQAGLIFAFGVAVDPGLVALSRLAGGLTPALAFSLLAVVLYANRRPILAGIFAGLALLAGPAVLHGALVLAAAWGLSRLLDQSLANAPNPDDTAETIPVEESEPAFVFSANLLRPTLFSAGAVLLLAGTLFLRAPQGLGALVGTLPAYLTGWAQPSGVPALRLLAGLLFYQPLVLVFAVIGLVRGWMALAAPQPTTQRSALLAARLSLWAAVALALGLLYPARQVGDLAWLLVPLWALAALELARHLPAGEDVQTRRVAAGLALLLIVLVALSWISLLGLARLPGTLLYAALILGALLMGVIVTLLVAAGWSMPAARLGLAWAASICLLLGLLSSTWGMAYLRPNSAQELWSVSPSAGQIDLLVTTLADLSQWNIGLRQELDVLVTVESPALRWALRDFPRARFVSGLAATEAPGVVITLKDQETPTLAQAYRGQDFVWRVYPGWEGLLPPNAAAWFVFRQAPLVSEQVVLWARIDLFPGGALGQSEQPAELPEPAVPDEEEQIVP